MRTQSNDQEPSAARQLKEDMLLGHVSAAGLGLIKAGRRIQCMYGRMGPGMDRLEDVARVRFPIGSITKTFLGVAVARLIKMGDLSGLDVPVNDILVGRRIRGPRVDRITAAHLLSHCAGFDHRLLGLATNGSQRHGELGKWRPFDVPIRDEPGERVSYSNIGSAWLGAVIEDVSGLGIDVALRNLVWQPLGLSDTTLHGGTTRPPDVPAPKGGLDRIDGGLPPFHPFIRAAGASLTTVPDMLSYMDALISLGNGESGAFLPPLLGTRLFAPLGTTHGHLPWIGFQFVCFMSGNELIVGHTGSWPGYAAALFVNLARREGIFAATVGELSSEALRERLLPEIGATACIEGQPLAAPHRALEGHYLPGKLAQHSPEFAALALAGTQSTKVTGNQGRWFVDGQGPLAETSNGLLVPCEDLGRGRLKGAIYGVAKDGASRGMGIAKFHDLDVRLKIPPGHCPARLAARLRLMAVLSASTWITWIDAAPASSGLVRTLGASILAAAVLTIVAALSRPQADAIADLLAGRTWRLAVAQTAAWSLPLAASLLAWAAWMGTNALIGQQSWSNQLALAGTGWYGVLSAFAIHTVWRLQLFTRLTM